MIIQMFGMDAETREKIGKALAKKLDAWYLDSRDLPMGHTQPQQARWLRVVAKAFDRNHHGDIITSGYFATAEAREQYRIEKGRQVPDFTVFINTVQADQLHTIPGYIERKIQVADDHNHNEFQELSDWEHPGNDEYDFEITEKGDPEILANLILEKYKSKMTNYKIKYNN
jgi:hypothetical protein